MSNVVTLTGEPLLTYLDIFERTSARDDVEHVVMIVARKDGFFEVSYDRQPVNQVVMAAAALNVVSMDLARGTVDDDA